MKSISEIKTESTANKWLRIQAVIFFLSVAWLAALTGVFLCIGGNLIQLAFCLILFFLFSTWGHLLVYPICYKNGKLLEGFIWGTVSGIASGSLITSIIVYLVGWDLLTIVLIVTVLPAAILIFVVQINKNTKKSINVRFNDIDILFVALLSVTLFFYFPFKNLGILIDGKYLYQWLFGHDFIIRMVHIISLSKGLPLDSFFFAGETLSYYWLAYVYPALLINIDVIKISPQQLLQLTVFLYSLLSTASLFLFFKSIINKRKYVLMLTFLALYCYSYSYLYVVGLKLTTLTGSSHLNILGHNLPVFSGFSHTFYRFFLVQPQASLGMAIMLMIFSFYEKKRTLYGFVIIGLLTGLLFGVDATNGIMMGMWLGCMSFFAFFIHKDKKILVGKKYLLSLTCAGLIYACLFIIEMYSLKNGKGVLQLNFNWFFILISPFYFILEFGPMLILGFAGMVLMFKKKEPLKNWGYPYIILFGIALFFNFFITNPTEVFFGLLKATRVIPICLLAFTAYFLSNSLQTKKKKVLTVFLLILALPSFFMDSFIASDISKPSTFVRQSDMEAAIWIKNNLPDYAIIQANPNYPGVDKQYTPQYSYSIIPIFAQRRTAIGEWKASSQEHGSVDEVGERFHSVIKMYTTLDIHECKKILDKYRIDYIYVGELEAKLYPESVKKFINNNNFEPVYSKNDVIVYKYNKREGIIKKYNG